MTRPNLLSIPQPHRGFLTFSQGCFFCHLYHCTPAVTRLKPTEARAVSGYNITILRTDLPACQGHHLWARCMYPAGLGSPSTQIQNLQRDRGLWWKWVLLIWTQRSLLSLEPISLRNFQENDRQNKTTPVFTFRDPSESQGNLRRTRGFPCPHWKAVLLN